MGFRSFLFSLALLASLQGVQSSLISGSGSNVVAYWGHEIGHHCLPIAQVLALAFIANFSSSGTPELSFVSSSTNIGHQIIQCQKQGKSILLSAGGSAFSGGWASPAQAATSATQVWEMFGPDQGTSVQRPFGNAVVDGFDFDFDAPTTNLLTFARTLRQLMDSNTSKPFYMTAAPQCQFPDKNVGDLLNAGLMDAIWVQFYNNPECGIPSSNRRPRRAIVGAPFNLETWANWASNHVVKHTLSPVNNVTNWTRFAKSRVTGPGRLITKLRKTQVYIGLPAKPRDATNGGSVPPKHLPNIIEYSKSLPNFGGVMIWEASGTTSNPRLLPTVKKVLTAGAN